MDDLKKDIIEEFKEMKDELKEEIKEYKEEKKDGSITKAEYKL